MDSTMRRLVCLVALSAAISACGSEPPATPDSGPGPDTGGSCTDACTTLGETRCAGSVIEGCAIGSSGCLEWRAGIDCASSSTTCDDAVEPAACVSSAGTCTDGAQNQDETDVDCGGTRCDACALGEGCARAADCESRNCDTTSMTCVAPSTPTCTDGTQNQDETDIDCGGAICGDCGVGAMCSGPGDCTSGQCTAGRCAAIAGTCTDGAENQDETDVDCGGTICGPCGVGLGCSAPTDCTTMNCEAGVCGAVLPRCDDGIRNGTETDVDCGGPTCADCADGSDCAVGTDCASGFCNAMTCVPAGSCTDGMQNGDESDVDCGGRCADCPNGRGCTAGTDCRSGTCDSAGSDLCVDPGGPTCTDGMLNRDETDVDCGGLYCPRCGAGDLCEAATDCTSGVCDLRPSPHVCGGSTPSYTVDEDFETGDFSRFPYEFAETGTAMPWAIETTSASCHAGSFCMRTNPTHPTSSTSTVTLHLSVREDTNISFWVRTNLEPGEHFFRFYVDGVMEHEITGVTPWTLVTIPVPATGAMGPDRELRWEYVRSAFVSPDHTPWYEVWVDDVDMPAWNTEPTIPELVRPTNGQLTTDTTPTFAWRSFDADFDPITYEMQYSTSPTFPAGTTTISTGETNDTMFTPPAALADGVYYWRVRAKDNSNFRWSSWSTVYSVEVSAGHEYGSIWRQTVADQFSMNTLQDIVVNPSAVVPRVGSVDRTLSAAIVPIGGTANVTFTGLTPLASATSGTLTISASGDFSTSTEYATIRFDGATLSPTYAPNICNSSRAYTIADVRPSVADGSATVQFTTSSGVNAGGCSGQTETWSARLVYASPVTPVMTSIPIEFSTFEGRTLWEKIQVVGTGTITIQVLDAAGALIPDSVIPGNAAGFTQRTIHLWHLDPMRYPVIRLRARLGTGAVLDEWSVVGNDRFEWLFSHAGDLEGWVGEDLGATPTTTVGSGALRLSSLAAGTDPRVVYTFPQPVDARRFTRLVVRVRTSNNYSNDDVTLFWSSNYGGIDTRRSFTEPGVFLFTYQDIVFDLTTVPTAPGETWRGNVESIRIDPVIRFLNETLMPADGWFEIDSIAID